MCTVAVTHTAYTTSHQPLLKLSPEGKGFNPPQTLIGDDSTNKMNWEEDKHEPRALKRFATWASNHLREQVTAKAAHLAVTPRASRKRSSWRAA